MKQRKRSTQPTIPQVPFNEALKRVWASPPQHKVSKPKQKKIKARG